MTVSDKVQVVEVELKWRFIKPDRTSWHYHPRIYLNDKNDGIDMMNNSDSTNRLPKDCPICEKSFD